MCIRVCWNTPSHKEAHVTWSVILHVAFSMLCKKQEKSEPLKGACDTACHISMTSFPFCLMEKNSAGKPFGLLVPLCSTYYYASTYGLSTKSSFWVLIAIPHLGAGFALEMPSALILTGHGYSAMLLA